MSPTIKGYIASAALVLLTLSLMPAPTAQAADYGKRTFKVTAYYSPLPNQSFYLKGNYEAEVRLNGAGKTGASGRAVFPGMIAAPKSYNFGTKISLEGLGIGTVADRGGAIVRAGEGGQDYDRIDVWMGYGEPGLRRALKWGVRVVQGEVLQDTTIADSIFFDSMDPSIASLPPQERVKEAIATDASQKMIAAVEAISEEDELLNSFPGIMGKDAQGVPVKILQSALKQLGYYKAELSGVYDNDTIDAMLRFQIDKKLITGLDDTAAGYFGTKTRVALVEQLQALNITMEVLENEALLEDMRGTEIRDEAQLKQDLVFSNMPRSQMDMLKSTPLVATTAAQQPSAIPVAQPVTSVRLSSVATDAPASKALTLGEKDISLLKRQMRSLGFYDGDTSGTWNKALSTAIATLQQQGGLTQDGNYTEATRTYLTSLWAQHVSNWGFTATLEQGSSGEQVTKLQSLLTRYGYFNGLIDGNYNQATADAVLAFQVHYGVVADTTIYGAGMVGPHTVDMLNTVLFQLQ